MSKNIIYYFTGTGNSLAVARSISSAMTDVVLIPMLKEDALTYIDTHTESIGLIYPIHVNALPHAVIHFIQKIHLLSMTYIYAVATHGGIPGMSGLYLNKILKKQGIDLKTYYEIEMLNNTPKGIAPKFLMRLNWELEITPEEVEHKLSVMKIKIENIVKGITDKEETTLQKPPSGTRRMMYWMMQIMWLISNPSKYKLQFLVDDSCNGCGICQQVCVTKRIKMNEDKPEWVHDYCNFCYACFNYCPKEAIGVKYYTKKLGRYHHPDISAQDIAAQIK
ncbi:EFR1 family ferrodoxin [Petrocella sp. FN5]|uniref:EFR1 family ferrodoxin n=1 Tax=Petrocella sp. FN5 TaxID=3032002 RepID=UPI0023DADF6C|nr:EFR1 family ferrodoxin [Petrocella sp. FN5]MDF1616916.1 EFR1 family ferrodoxin [Petrocella sp. FN5]